MSDPASSETPSNPPARRSGARGLLVSVAIAAAVVVLAVVLSSRGADPAPEVTAERGPAQTAEVASLLKGIPQSGTSLGSPEAPWVLTEFVDVQCPYCKLASEQVLPDVIQRHVRSGQVRVELRTLRFIGKDSERGARAAHAAASVDRMWNFVELWFANQGPEGSGYATDTFIAQIAKGAGVPAQLVADGVRSRALDSEITAAERQAQAAGVESTPTFQLGRRAGTGEPMEADAVLDALAAIDPS